MSKNKKAIIELPIQWNLENAPKDLTIYDLGWTKEQAAAMRGLYGSILEDWDDPSMDVYDERY